jgi:two-component system response regulator AtoC
MLIPFVFGSHERMKDLERRVGSIARSGLPVLIEGATGTGKEAMAELLHELSGLGNGITRVLCRKSGPVVVPGVSMLNGTQAGGAGAMDLSELYRRAQGTVFLKNVHLLSPTAQEQLMAALDHEAASRDRNGEHPPAKRLVSSATEPLAPLVKRRELSPALYHRLSVYRINLPLLRERGEDIPELFTHMVRHAANGSGAAPPVTTRLLDALLAYDWPGNLRELQNIARTYVITAQDEETIAELSSRSRLEPRLTAQRDSRSLKELVRGASQKLESEIILETLAKHHWNRRRAALALQISYRSLLYKMKSCNLRIEPQTAPEGR